MPCLICSLGIPLIIALRVCLVAKGIDKYILDFTFTFIRLCVKLAGCKVSRPKLSLIISANTCIFLFSPCTNMTF